jgi:hypothetical protein
MRKSSGTGAASERTTEGKVEGRVAARVMGSPASGISAVDGAAWLALGAGSAGDSEDDA